MQWWQLLNSVYHITAKETVYELSAGPATAVEAAYELSACPVMAAEAIVNLRALCSSSTWSTLVSCAISSTLVVVCSTVGIFGPSVKLWWSSAPPWCSSAPPWRTSSLLAPPWPPVLPQSSVLPHGPGTPSLPVPPPLHLPPELKSSLVEGPQPHHLTSPLPLTLLIPQNYISP